jgi:predicted AAA+ superfamily ATPase
MYPRHAESRVREALTDTRVVAIAGPRQSGKTTLARKIAGETHSYLTLDDPAVLAAATTDPSGLIRRLDRAVIDEIQRAPNLTLAIKQAVDEDRRPGRFLITGSADILAMPKAAESLAGRIEIVTLLPLSRSEIAGRPPSSFIARAFDGNVVNASQGKAGLPELVLAGGYPEGIARLTERRRRDWHRAYLRSVLERDAREISSAERLDRLPDLFGLLAARAGQLLNWSALGNDARLDGKTVERYVRLLEQLYLVRRVPAWSGNQTQRLVSTPKLHFVDSGLLATTLNLATAQIALDRSPLGSTLESFVFSELAKAASVADDELMISHYRDKDQVEVDFVIENGAGLVLGIEVKASSSVQASDFRGLRRLKDRVGSRFAQGILLYDGKHVLPFGEKLNATPISALWAE